MSRLTEEQQQSASQSAYCLQFTVHLGWSFLCIATQSTRCSKPCLCPLKWKNTLNCTWGYFFFFHAADSRLQNKSLGFQTLERLNKVFLFLASPPVLLLFFVFTENMDAALKQLCSIKKFIRRKQLQTRCVPQYFTSLYRRHETLSVLVSLSACLMCVMAEIYNETHHKISCKPRSS